MSRAENVRPAIGGHPSRGGYQHLTAWSAADGIKDGFVLTVIPREQVLARELASKELPQIMTAGRMDIGASSKCRLHVRGLLSPRMPVVGFGPTNRASLRRSARQESAPSEHLSCRILLSPQERLACDLTVSLSASERAEDKIAPRGVFECAACSTTSR